MIDVAALDLRYITNTVGEKTAVIVSMDDFEELLEDLDDLAAVAERREESTIPHQNVVLDLKQHGFL